MKKQCMVIGNHIIATTNYNDVCDTEVDYSVYEVGSKVSMSLIECVNRYGLYDSYGYGINELKATLKGCKNDTIVDVYTMVPIGYFNLK
jgi:hypothetical protein